MQQRFKIPVGITASGQFYPERVVTNFDIAEIIDTSNEWIFSRTGIKTRRWATTGTTSSDLGAEALKMALKNRGMNPNDLDAIIVATMTPDMPLPCTAALVQKKIGANNAYGFDINAACSGFLFALTTGASLISGGGLKCVAIVGCDVMTSIIDKTDRNTAVLFGDGAGAVILEKVDYEYGLLDFEHRTDGNGANLLFMPGGGSLNPASIKSIGARMHFLQQNGKEVYKHAVQGMSDISNLLLSRNNIDINDINFFVPHQANIRIIEAISKRLEMPMDRIASNISEFANTTAATIPTALHHSIVNKKIKHGDLVLFAAFGAGFTWGSALMRWV